MSYQVLARKWRPKMFLEMAGQDHILQALANALRQQRLHHAYLFSGTRGVGKTTIARIFAKCLNCETNGISPEPCGICDSCVEIAEGRFVDLIEVDAASRTKVEDTRELLENVQYVPSRGRFKVYLIDEVHMLSTHSFNALLKTLEEPPLHVKFFLVTTDPQKLPVTILSRCLQFNLKNMTPQRVVDYLQIVLNSEQVPFDQSALWQIGQAANGSMRDALSLTDQAIAFGNGTISESGVTVMLGLVNQAQVIDLVESVVSKNASDVLYKVESLADYQPDFVTVCDSMLDVLHRVAIEQQVPGALLDQLGDLSRIQHIASIVSAEEIQVMYQSLLIGRRDLYLAHSVRSGFEILMLRLIAFRPIPPMAVSHDSGQSPKTTVQQTVMAAEASVSSVNQSQSATALNSGELLVSEYQTTELLNERNDDIMSNFGESSVIDFSSALEKKTLLLEAERSPWKATSEIIDSKLKMTGDVEFKAFLTDAGSVQEIIDAPEDTVESMLEAEFKVDSEVEPVFNTTLETVIEKVKVVSIKKDKEKGGKNEQEVEDKVIVDVSGRSDPTENFVKALGSDLVVSESKLEETESNGFISCKEQSSVDRLTFSKPTPEIIHFKNLTMKLWWLVAPRLHLTGLAQNILINSNMVNASDKGVRLQVSLEYGHMLNQSCYEQIQGALSDFFATHVPLIIDTVEQISGMTAERFVVIKRAEALQLAINHLNSHPVVQALLSTMGAQLVYNTVKVKV